jgi:hypothetical protein
MKAVELAPFLKGEYAGRPTHVVQGALLESSHAMRVLDQRYA